MTFEPKLVRDKIPEIIKSENRNCKYEILDDESFYNELLKKLHEEVIEIINSKSKEEAISEIADLLDVLEYLIKLNESDEERIDKIRKEKRKEIGGFDKKIFLKYKDPIK